ncbi:hypothetical protein SCLCIDRAFT_1223127 [Scleroderma citrinum Foug A]|uniref:Protein kinase domain-containing protein n=1 Tax=Scleroderma citrinum Foug A TaxID=1036808 RepID=A0A0C3CX63_9AGAM|nr:hypothetical protein SCLCIDRAFT_1223127 [Scleroderma citrinum Foug A]
MPPEELENYSSSVTKPNRNVGLRELQNVVDQRFSSIDLGDQVTRDSSKIVGFGNYGLVYEGTLRAEHKKVAVKVIRYGDKSARPELEVSILQYL